MQKIRTIFLGTPQFAATILETLIASPYRPTFVITEPDRPVGRSQTVTPPPVKVVAQQHNIPVNQPATPHELEATLIDVKADLGVVAAYGRILTPTMLETATRGFVNVHASLLPNHRGASPIQAAILAGETETGVTIMQMDDGLDTGPIVSWAPVALLPTTITADMTELLADLGGQLLLETLPAYLAGTTVAQAQAPTSSPVSKRLTREAGHITGREHPDHILRMLRAYQDWPGVWFEIEQQRLILLRAHQAHGRVIPDQLQLAGKNPVDWPTFQRDRADLAQKILDYLNPKGA